MKSLTVLGNNAMMNAYNIVGNGLSFHIPGRVNNILKIVEIPAKLGGLGDFSIYLEFYLLK